MSRGTSNGRGNKFLCWILSSAALLTARQIVESVHLRLKGRARVGFGAHCRANLYNVQTSLNVSTKTEKIGKLFILYQRLSRRMEDKAPRRCTFNCRLQGYSLHLCQAQRSVENHHMKFRTCCLNLSRKKLVQWTSADSQYDAVEAWGTTRSIQMQMWRMQWSVENILHEVPGANMPHQELE